MSASLYVIKLWFQCLFFSFILKLSDFKVFDLFFFHSPEDWNMPDDSSNNGSIKPGKRYNQRDSEKGDDWSVGSQSSSPKKWIHDKYFEVEGIKPLPEPVEMRGEGRTERRGRNAWIDDDDEPSTLSAG